MEKGIYVKDILPNTEVEGLFAAIDPDLREGKNGPFWKLGLLDATGTIDAKIWSPLSTEIREITSGEIALVSGKASVYRETLQLSVSAFEPLSSEDLPKVDLAFFTRSSPYDREEMFSTLRLACMEEFRYVPWRRLITIVFKDQEIKDAFMRIPAAKVMHHAYVGGLLEHTLSVFNLCRSLSDFYPDLDRQTLLVGALFHDIGKIREFSGGIANDYTDEGRLIGHISLGLEILEPFLARSSLETELKSHLKHLILSHHGLHEYGAPCLPQTPEAFMLHYADNMDAKMNQFHNLFGQSPDQTQKWSSRINGLDRQIFRAYRTPVPEGREKGLKHGADSQCLSLWKE